MKKPKATKVKVDLRIRNFEYSLCRESRFARYQRKWRVSSFFYCPLTDILLPSWLITGPTTPDRWVWCTTRTKLIKLPRFSTQKQSKGSRNWKSSSWGLSKSMRTPATISTLSESAKRVAGNWINQIWSPATGLDSPCVDNNQLARIQYMQ